LDDNEAWVLHGEEYTPSGDRSSGLLAPGSFLVGRIGLASMMEGLTPERVSDRGEEGSAGIKASATWTVLRAIVGGRASNQLQ
jgi:hypothetical protein